MKLVLSHVAGSLLLGFGVAQEHDLSLFVSCRADLTGRYSPIGQRVLPLPRSQLRWNGGSSRPMGSGCGRAVHGSIPGSGPGRQVCIPGAPQWRQYFCAAFHGSVDGLLWRQLAGGGGARHRGSRQPLPAGVLPGRRLPRRRLYALRVVWAAPGPKTVLLQCKRREPGTCQLLRDSRA